MYVELTLSGSGVPHSLQGLKGGVEFLLVFDDGSFSEDNTFLASEVFAHNPVSPHFLRSSLSELQTNHPDQQKEVLSKNFGGLPLSAWDNIPPGELFIFPGTKAPTDISAQNIVGSAGLVPTAQSYTYHASLASPNHVTTGGSVTVIDPLVFPIASKFSAAIVTIKPGAIREIHWHTTSDEWNFFIGGSARIGIYVSGV